MRKLKKIFAWAILSTVIFSAVFCVAGALDQWMGLMGNTGTKPDLLTSVGGVLGAIVLWLLGVAFLKGK